jgi:hypothetical protein
MTTSRNLPDWWYGVNVEFKLLVCELSIHVYAPYHFSSRRREPGAAQEVNSGGGA